MSINAMDVLSFIFGGNDGDGSFILNVSVYILTVENCRKSIISIYIKDYSNTFVWMKTVRWTWPILKCQCCYLNSGNPLQIHAYLSLTLPISFSIYMYTF